MTTFGAPAGGTYVLKSGDVAKHHGVAYGNPSTGQVQTTIAASLVVLGVFDIPKMAENDTVGQVTGDGTLTVDVDFCRERDGKWYTNDGTNPVTTLFTTAYGLANDVACTVSTGHTALGLVLALDTTKGVFCVFP